MITRQCGCDRINRRNNSPTALGSPTTGCQYCGWKSGTQCGSESICVRVIGCDGGCVFFNVERGYRVFFQIDQLGVLGLGTQTVYDRSAYISGVIGEREGCGTRSIAAKGYG